MSILGIGLSDEFNRSLGKRMGRRFSAKSADLADFFARIFPECAMRFLSQASMALERN